MAKRCEFCGKGGMRNLLVSHAKNRVHTTRKPNLRRAKILISGKPKRVWLCTKCYRRATKVGKTDFEKIKKIKEKEKKPKVSSKKASEKK